MGKLIVTVTGPSGSGKTELVHALCENHNFAKLVSVTTRPMRPGEVEGKDYYFISEEKFTELEQNEKLVQATVFNGCSYGTTTDELNRIYAIGKIPIVIVEPGGVPQFEAIAKTHGYRLKTLFMSADLQTLINRYLRRTTGADISARTEYHAKRLAGITGEMDWSGEWDFDMRIYNDTDNLSIVKNLAEGVAVACG